MPINGITLQLFGLSLDFFGALLLTVSEIKRRSQIEEEAKTCWDSNPSVEKNLKRKSLFSIIATGLLVLGFILQMIGIMVSSGWIHIDSLL